MNWIQKRGRMAVDRTIRTYVLITVFQMYVPLPVRIVYARNLLVHGRNNIKNLVIFSMINFNLWCSYG